MHILIKWLKQFEHYNLFGMLIMIICFIANQHLYQFQCPMLFSVLEIICYHLNKIKCEQLVLFKNMLVFFLLI